MQTREQYATPAEVASRLRCSRATVYRAIDRGELAAVRLGETGSLRIRADAIDEFVRPVRAEGADAALPPGQHGDLANAGRSRSGGPAGDPFPEHERNH